jgi:lactoylglutathione lyase
MPKLIHTCFWVGDVEKSIAFYELLGFKVFTRDLFRGLPYAFLGLPGDGPRIELNADPAITKYDVGNGYRHIAVTCDDMAATLAGLAEAGFEPNEPPVELPEIPGASVCYIKDPDGYEIELFSPFGPDFPEPSED